MNFSFYPIKDSDFYQTNNQNVKKTDNNCLDTQEYKPTGPANVMKGYHKPLNEVCKPIYNNLTNNDPTKNSTISIWNNMTKRKSLVKDY